MSEPKGRPGWIVTAGAAAAGIDLDDIAAYRAREDRQRLWEYQAPVVDQRLVVDPDEINNWIERQIASRQLPPVGGAAAELIRATMLFLCNLPVDLEARNLAYAKSAGRMALHEMLNLGTPMACRELSILGNAILSYYGIPAKYRRGAVTGGAAAVAAAASSIHAVIEIYGGEVSSGEQNRAICYLDPTHGAVYFYGGHPMVPKEGSAPGFSLMTAPLFNIQQRDPTTRELIYGGKDVAQQLERICKPGARADAEFKAARQEHMKSASGSGCSLS